MNKLLNKIGCVNCNGFLYEKEKLIICKKCGRKYAYKNGILLMVSDISLQDKQNLYQKNFYDDHYSTEYANKDFEWRKRWVVRLLKFLPKSKNSLILDLACGQAYMTLAVAQKGYNVIACDISINGLMRARSEAVRLGVEKSILFIACDINKIRFKKNTFDFLIMLHVLEHLTYDKAVIKKIISYSKLSATYYIGVPLSLAKVFPFFIPLYMYSDKRVGHKRRYTIESIMRLFTFKAKPVYTVYTGHLVKFVGLLLSKVGVNSLESKIEDLDEKTLHSSLWASNITTVIRRAK
jgi:SAM-dependent methyltransferase